MEEGDANHLSYETASLNQTSKHFFR